MNDSQIKRGIDEVIGEEKWLTDHVVRKMMSPKKNKKPRLAMPLIATIIIACIALFLIVVEQKEAPPLQQQTGKMNVEQFYSQITSEQGAEAAINYLQAIATEDYSALGTVSSTYAVSSPKEIFQKYESVDFETLRLLKVVPSMGEPTIELILLHENTKDHLTYLHRLYLEPTDERTYKVQEDIYADWVVYEPFTLPTKVEVTYSEVTNGTLSPLDATVGQEEIGDSVPLSDGGVASFMVHQDVVNLVIEKAGKQHQIEYIDYYDRMNPAQYIIAEVNLQEGNNPLRVISVASSTTGLLRYVYFSEREGRYQFTEVNNVDDITIVDVDGNGRDEILFHDSFGTLVKIEDDQMKRVLLKNMFSKPEWVSPLLSIHYEGTLPTVTYSDSSENRSGTYKFTTANELELIQE